MQALNEHLNFDQLTSEQKKAFIGQVQKKRFEKDHLFYKMSRDVNHANFGVTCWWSSYEPASREDIGFAGAWNHPLGIKNYARINAAVSLDWNTLDNILMMRLREPVWGFIGRAARQPADNKKDISKEKFGSIYLGGGSVQVCLPNLTIAQVEWLMSVPV